MAGARKAVRCHFVRGSQRDGKRLDRCGPGRFPLKKRIARPDGGKSNGYRTLLSARIGRRYVFLHGFPKNHKANITLAEKKALQFAGKVFLDLADEAFAKALQAGVLSEVHCEQAH